MKKSRKYQNRRTFLAGSLGLSVGFLTLRSAKLEKKGKSILISKDGKLYEVSRSVLERGDIKRSCSTDEVVEWIKSSDNGGKE